MAEPFYTEAISPPQSIHSKFWGKQLTKMRCAPDWVKISFRRQPLLLGESYSGHSSQAHLQVRLGDSGCGRSLRKAGRLHLSPSYANRSSPTESGIGIRLQLLVLSGPWGDMLSLTPVLVLLPGSRSFNYTSIRHSSLLSMWLACACMLGVGGDARRASPVLPS